MNDFEWASKTSGRAAIVMFAAAIMLLGRSAVHVIRIEPVPEGPAAAYVSTAALAPPPGVPATDIDAAVEEDVFTSDRSAPAQPYRVPGEDSDEGVARVDPVLPVVLGTAMSDQTHSFATVQLGDDRSVILRVGNKIGEYTVQSIERGRVVFTTQAKKRIEIQELKP